MSRDTLYIDVQVHVGSDILDACVDAVQLATKLGICVWFNFNGVTCFARPESDPEKLAANYRAQLDGDRPHKIAIDA